MSYLELPDGQRMDIFGSGGGQRLADESETPFIGAIPMDPTVRMGGDTGTPVVISHPNSAVALALRKIAEDVAARVSLAALRQQANFIPINLID
jgi:ATP-binding protein involved in chromosome partitioning